MVYKSIFFIKDICFIAVCVTGTEDAINYKKLPILQDLSN